MSDRARRWGWRALLSGVAFVALTSPVRASEVQPGDTVGRFPWARLGIAGGFSGVPIPYVGLSEGPTAKTDLAGLVGPQLDLYLGGGPALLNVQGVYNALGSGVRWMGRGELVLGARTTHNVLKSMSESAPNASGYSTRTTEHYVHKHVPLLIGVAAGASAWRVAEVSYTSPSYAVEGGVTNTRGAATLTTIDAGFKLISPQIELGIGPLLELPSKSYGVRWVYGMAFPVGDRPFYFRLSGDHVLGSDPLDNSGRRLGMAVMLSLGLGTGLGLGL